MQNASDVLARPEKNASVACHGSALKFLPRYSLWSFCTKIEAISQQPEEKHESWKGLLAVGLVHFIACLQTNAVAWYLLALSVASHHPLPIMCARDCVPGLATRCPWHLCQLHCRGGFVAVCFDCTGLCLPDQDYSLE